MGAEQTKRFLITGGFGYVGSWITRHLASLGHEVFVLTRGNEAPDLGAAYATVRADLEALSPEELAHLLPGGLDGCVHLASANETFVEGYAQKALSSNALGTRTLLEAFRLRAGSGESPPFFVYFSTFHVYGRISGLVDETTPPAPLNDYSLTHFFAEEYCRMYARVYGQPSAVVRLSNGYGAPLTSPFGKWYLLINDLCKTAFTEGRVVLYANPALERDFIWLGDVARATETLLLNPGLAGKIFNIASARSVSLGEIAALAAETAAAFLGREIPLRLAFLEEHKDAPPVPEPLKVDNSAARAALGLACTQAMREEMLAVFRFLERYGPA